MKRASTDVTWMIAAFITGLLIRLLVVSFGGAVSHDAAAFYLPNARALVEGGLGNWDGMTVEVPLGFPTLVAIFSWLVPDRDLELSALLLSAIGGAAILFPVYGLARAFFPGETLVHRFALWVAALQPFSVRFGGDAKADSLYAFFFACALWAGVQILKRPRAKLGALFGVFLGIAYLFREEVLGLAILLALGVSWMAWRRWRRGEALRSYCLGVSGAGALAILMLLPALIWYASFVHHRVGVWTIGAKAGVLQDFGKIGRGDVFNTLNESKTMTLKEEKLGSAEGYQSFNPVKLFIESPAEMTLSFLYNLQQFLRHFPAVLGMLSIFFVLGLFVHRQEFAARGGWVLIAVYVFYAMMYSLFYTSRRFWLPLLPLALPWCAAGAAFSTTQLARRWRVTPAWVIVGIALLTLPQGLARIAWTPAGPRSSAERILGERLAEKYGTGQVYVSAKGKVAWYAEGSQVSLPTAPLADVATFMSLRNARFLVVERERIARRYPELWQELKVSPLFREIDREVHRNVDLRAYELLPPNQPGKTSTKESGD